MSQSQPRLKTSAMIASIADEKARRPSLRPSRRRAVKTGGAASGNRRNDRGPVKIYRSAYFRPGLPGSFLPDGHGRAAADGGGGGGMAKEGFIPFATTYAAFATRRAYDFIHQVIAEEHLNVKICAALPGLTTGYGPSHQATRRSGDYARYPRHGHRRSLRCAGDRAGGAGHCRSPGAGVYAPAAR